MGKNKKYESNNTVLIGKMLILNIISTIAFVTILMLLVSLCTLKLDLTEQFSYYCSFLIVFLVSLCNGFLFGKMVQTNKVLVGIVSNILFILFLVLSNVFVPDDKNILLFLVKIALCIICGAIGGLLSIKRKRKFKIK